MAVYRAVLVVKRHGLVSAGKIRRLEAPKSRTLGMGLRTDQARRWVLVQLF